MTLLRLLTFLTSLLVLSACSESEQESSLAQIDRSSLSPAKGMLLIVIDTLRADHLGIYNPDKPFSPALDAFARESIVFDAMYASAPWTRSSIASIFTSRYPTELNIHGKQDALAEESLTVAEVFSEHGFQTHGINTNSNVNPIWGFGQGFDYYGPPVVPGWKKKKGFAGFPAQLVTKATLRRLEEQDPAEPLFLYALYIDPHGPYFTYPALMDRPEPPGRFNGNSRDELEELDKLSAENRTQEDEALIKYQYESEVRYTDLWLGRLFDGLKALGIYDDYVIVVTADHGEELWDHGQRPHGTSLHDEMVRVPLIIRYPSDWGIDPRRINVAAGHVDISPTLVAAAGIEVPDDFAGVDLWDEIEGYYLTMPDVLAYSEMQRRGLDLEAVSNGREKLIHDRAFERLKQPNRSHVIQEGDTLWTISLRYFGNRNHAGAIVKSNQALHKQKQGPDLKKVELQPGVEISIPDYKWKETYEPYQFYDMTVDAREKEDIYDGQSTPQQQLTKQLQELAAEIKYRQGAELTVSEDEMDEETRKQLRGLGYIQ